MRLFTLIGIILLLLLPFSIIRTTTESDAGDSTTMEYLGLLYSRTTFKAESLNIQWENGDSFNVDWLEEDGRYDGYFGDLWAIGLVVLILLIVGLGLAITETKSNNSTYLLILAGVLLFILRLLYLNDFDRSFYEKDQFGPVSQTQIEFPVGFILSLIFGIMDYRKDE